MVLIMCRHSPKMKKTDTTNRFINDKQITHWALRRASTVKVVANVS